MKFLTLPIRPRHVPRTLFPQRDHLRKPISIRNISTTPITRSVLGLDNLEHWTESRPLPRGLTLDEKRERRAARKTNPGRLKVYPCTLPSARAACKDPIAAVTAAQLSVLDPTGAKAKFFNKKNLEGAKVGDILLVRTKDGDPVSGVCLNIRRTGVDTSILLRNNLTRVGVEIWIKVFSPNVEAIEVVQRKAKPARRAKLYYMRYVDVLMRLSRYATDKSIGNRSMIWALCRTSSQNTYGRGRSCDQDKRMVHKGMAVVAGRVSGRATGDDYLLWIGEPPSVILYGQRHGDGAAQTYREQIDVHTQLSRPASCALLY